MVSFPVIIIFTLNALNGWRLSRGILDSSRESYTDGFDFDVLMVECSLCLLALLQTLWVSFPLSFLAFKAGFSDHPNDLLMVGFLGVLLACGLRLLLSLAQRLIPIIKEAGARFRKRIKPE